MRSTEQIGFPVWRYMSSDGEIWKEKKRLEREAAGKRA
jgi:hypothetical protein